MLIVMDVPVSGGRADGTPWPPVGVPFEVGEAEAAELIQGGLAHEPTDEDREMFEAMRPGTVLEESGEAPVHMVVPPQQQGENPAIVEVAAADAEDAAQVARDQADAMAEGEQPPRGDLPGQPGGVDAPGPSPAASTGKAGETGARPAASAPKADWVNYAVSQGADRGDAENMSRTELAARYGDTPAGNG